MIEFTDLLVMRNYGLHKMNNLVQHAGKCVENNQLRHALSCDQKFENVNQIKVDYPPLNNNNQIQKQDNEVYAKSFSSELHTEDCELSLSKWHKKWEIKCKEWLYQDKFNIELLSFAKKLYFH